MPKTTAPKYASFDVSREASDLIHKIVDRVLKTPALARMYGNDRQTIDMDLTACHANGTPLDLHKLLTFDAFNFMHDIGGIAQHLNRTTGELEDLFLPRCARPERRV